MVEQAELSKIGSVAVYAPKIWEETKVIFEEEPQRLQLEELNSEHQGRLTIIVDGIDFEVCYIKKDPKKLFVFMSGPGRADYSKAAFWLKSYSAYFEDSALYIDDPCNRQKKFAPTFFWGDENYCYRDLAIKIISKFQEIYGVANCDVIFEGESNAGLVAIYCASKIEGSQCIAMSPQVNMRIYMQTRNIVDMYNKLFGIDFLEHDYENRIDITGPFLANKHSRFFISSNIKCDFDFDQMKYLFSLLKKDIKYGLNVFGNITIYIAFADIPRPHSFSPTEGFVRQIYHYLKDYKFNDKLYFDFDSLSKSMFWYYREREGYRLYRIRSEKETAALKDQIVKKDQEIEKLKSNNNLMQQKNTKLVSIINIDRQMNEKKIQDIENKNLKKKTEIDNELKKMCNENKKLNLKIENIKKTLSYRIGSKIVTLTKSHNPLIYFVLPFYMLREYIDYKKNKQ